MNLAVSNIAWDTMYDDEMYSYLHEVGYNGLEIAPTQIFPESPYEKLEEAKNFAKQIYAAHSLRVCSMQSMWYGRQEKLFGDAQERQALMEYTKKAIDFANVMQCNNLVFGCPKNRIIGNKSQYGIAVDFFAELGEYASVKNTVVAIEANPAIYNTNFINTTKEAFSLCRDVNSQGIAVNLDCGTMIENKEKLHDVMQNMVFVHHIHLSEPYLVKLENRPLHIELYQLLKNEGYQGYISIEMKKYDDVNMIKDSMKYIREIFG